MAPGNQTLSEVLRRTIIALCEVHVTYERHLEVFGSIHVRADDGRTVSFMLEEIIAKIQQERAKEASSSTPRPRTPDDGTLASANPSGGNTRKCETPDGSTRSSSGGKEEKQESDALSEEIALMRAQYLGSPEVKVKIEKVFEENNIFIVKDEKRDSYAQFHITKVKKSDQTSETQSRAYDTITSLLESDVDLDKEIGQLLQVSEKNKEGIKVERESPPGALEAKIKIEKSGKEGEEFSKSFPGQGQPVFPSQEGFLFNNTFHFSNGVVSYDQGINQQVGINKLQPGSTCSNLNGGNGTLGPTPNVVPNMVPPPVGPATMGPATVGPTQFGSFQGWYTLQGVGMGPQIAPNHFECPFCGVILANKTNLKNHINSAHTRTKKFNCPTCGKVFYTSSAMNIHRRRNHLGLAKKYRCALCSKMFKIKSDLSAHMLDVHNKPRKLSPKTLHRLSQKVAQHLGDNSN